MRLLVVYVEKKLTKMIKCLFEVRDDCHYDGKYRGAAHFKST